MLVLLKKLKVYLIKLKKYTYFGDKVMKTEKITVPLAVIAILIGLFAVSMAFGSQGNIAPKTSESALDTVRATGAINACYIVYPPFVEKDLSTGKLSGVATDIFESIAKKMNVKINYTESTWANIVLDLSTNKCQVNVSGIFPLIERAYGGVMFTEPFGYIGNNGIVRAGDNRFHSLEELNRPDITVAVVEGEQGHEYAKKYLTAANLHVISSSDISLAFVEVSAGRADVGLGDDTTVDLYLRSHADVRKLLEKPYWQREVTFAVRDDDPKWLNFLNNAIDVLVVSGEVKEICDKYNFNIEIPEK